MGVEFLGPDVIDVIGGQTAPQVESVVPEFSSEFTVAGGCPGIANFDHIRKLPGATAAFRFLSPWGAPELDAAGAVMKERVNGFDILFPNAFHRIVSFYLPNARALLLQELFRLQN